MANHQRWRWADHQEFHGQLRNYEKYDWIAKVQYRRWHWLHMRYMFASHDVIQEKIDNDPLIQKCMRIRGKMLREAYGLDGSEYDHRFPDLSKNVTKTP